MFKEGNKIKIAFVVIRIAFVYTIHLIYVTSRNRSV